MKETIFSQKIQDEYFMNIALSLAKRGIGRTSPNPMVGCVIVKNNEILSYGWHKCYGGHHAEVNAVKKLTTSQLKGSTVYVTLEPCSHYGKTPPCATLLVEKKVGRVVIAMVDPNPKVNNRGIGILRTAGIQVDIGICEEAAKKLNKGFIKRIQENKPWVTVKIASSLDGNIALKNGESKWITSAVSREKVHQFRSENDAIITGIGTIISDDPEYTVRHSDGNSPCLIILDRKFVIPEDAKVLTNTTRKIVIFVDNTVDPIKIDRFLKKNINIFKIDSDIENINSYLLSKICEMGINYLMVESGPTISNMIIKNGLADELLLFVANKIMGNGKHFADNIDLDLIEKSFIIHNIMVHIYENDVIIRGEF